MPLDAMSRRVGDAIQERRLLTPRQPVLVAASGGPDSTALALILAALEHPVTLAYADHGWRGPPAAKDEQAAVAALGERIGAPVHVMACDPDVPHTEGAARTWRYQALARILSQTGLHVVATGHHQADQVETLLMRLLRGSGPVGLVGIPWQRELQRGRYRVVRPLLAVEPDALRDIVRATGLPVVLDPSNDDPHFERVRAGHRLADAPASTHASLLALRTRIEAQLRQREQALQARVGSSMRHHPWADAVELPRHLAIHDGIWMQLLLRQLGTAIHANQDGPWLTQRHVALAARVASQGGGLDLPRDLHWHVRGQRAWLWRRSNLADVPVLHCVPRDAVNADDARNETQGVLLDREVVGAVPTLRRLLADDTFEPFGRNQPSSVRVIDWLKRRGVPAPVRARQWVVVRSGERDAHIVWVVGHRVDRRAAIGSGQHQAVALSLHA